MHTTLCPRLWPLFNGEIIFFSHFGVLSYIALFLQLNSNLTELLFTVYKMKMCLIGLKFWPFPLFFWNIPGNSGILATFCFEIHELFCFAFSSRRLSELLGFFPTLGDNNSHCYKSFLLSFKKLYHLV